MTRVREAMYQCARCKKYVPAKEHILRRVRMIGPKGPDVAPEFRAINQEYSEHLCLGCMHKELDGKQTHSARRRRTDQGHGEEGAAVDDGLEPGSESEDTRAA